MKRHQLVLFVPLIALPLLLTVSGCNRERAERAAERRGLSWPGATEEYKKEVAREKQAGLPLDMRDMQQPAPPAERNAAAVYTQMTDVLNKRPLGDDEKRITGVNQPGLPTAAEIEEARQALARRGDLLHLAHEAAARPACVFTRDWGNPDPTVIAFPELATVRKAARLLTAESIVLAHDGKPLDAVREEALGFRVARHGASDRTLIGYLVGVAIDAIALGGMDKILCISKGDPQVARAVRNAVETGWHPRPVSTALRSEVAFQRGCVAMLRREGAGRLNSLLGEPEKGGVSKIDSVATTMVWNMVPGKWEEFLDANALYVLRQTTKMIAVADQPYPQAHPALKEISDEVNQENGLTPNEKYTHILAEIMFPESASVVQLRARIEAKAAAVRAGAAVLTYRAAHGGALPGSLAAALSPVPTDPFDEKPLRYRREGTGFVVYSVGPDSKFDGGTPQTKLSGGDAALLFRYSSLPQELPAK
jgi:hypothetical protein